MQKKIAIYLALSIIVVLLAKYIHQVVLFIDMAYYWLNDKLVPVFSTSYSGTMIRQVLVLSMVPVILAGIPALGYKMIAGKNLAWFFELTWVLWLVIALSVMLVS